MPIYDSRTMHTNEYVRIQKLFEMLHRSTQHVRIAVRMHTHIVACRVYPIYRLHVDTGCFRAIADRNTFRK